MGGSLNGPWKVALLGGPRLEGAGEVVTRFRTQKTAALLAYLAYFSQRVHPREELVERFWPEDDVEAGRASLRTAVASLRRQLEPPGTPAGTVLVADRANVRLDPAMARVDVHLFEQRLRAAAAPEAAGDPSRRAALLEEALALYAGDLLPGLYDEWVLAERERLGLLRLGALRDAARLCEAAGDLPRALEHARRAVAADPFDEDAQQYLVRLLAASGQPALALRQFASWERVLEDGTGDVPPPAARAFAERLREEAGPAAKGAPALGRGSRPAAAPPSRRPAREEKPPPAPVPPPPPLPPRTGPHLPPAFTRFFGREAEIAWAGDALRAPDVRLVTLTGPGGAGKTRLAVEAARRTEGLFGDAIWFVPLADVDDPRHVPAALLKSLQVTPSPQADPLDQACAALGDRPALLVLDNFEQLAESGASLLRDLLTRAPRLTCLVTSRQPLALPGEREWPLQPLPAPEHPGTPERLMEFASVQLFADRAQSVRPDFAVTARNAGAVAGLCERLEGVPLAIELAAAQIRVLTPAQMLAQIADRFDLLVSNRRDLPPRHRAMRAAVDWSYGMLPPDLRRLFARLSVFRGGWSLEAAAAVCGGRDEDAGALAYPLSALCARSLAAAAEAPGPDGEMRYRMLETLREYALEQLGPERGEAEARHRRYFVGLGEAAEPGLRSPAERQTWLERLDAEHDNLRAALAGCLAAPDAEAGLRLAGAVWRFWWLRGHWREGREHLGALLALPGGERPIPARAKALNGAANLADSQGDLAQASALQREALALFRELGDTRGAAGSATNLGGTLLHRGDFEGSRAALMEGLALWRAAGGDPNGDPDAGADVGVAVALTNLGNLCYMRGDLDGARPHYEESLALYRRMGDPQGISWSLHNLANVASDRGEYGAARALFEEALALKRERGDRWGTASTLQSLGNVLSAEGDLAGALALFEEAVPVYREVGDRQGLGLLLTSMASARAKLGAPRPAQAHLAEAFDIAEETDDHQVLISSLQSAAGLADAAGRPERSVRLWAAADAIGARYGASLPPAKRARWEETLAGLRAALGGAAFGKAWDTGHALEPGRAVAEARRAAG